MPPSELLPPGDGAIPGAEMGPDAACDIVRLTHSKAVITVAADRDILFKGWLNTSNCSWVRFHCWLQCL